MPSMLDELAYRLLPMVDPGRVLAASEWRTLVAASEALLDCSAIGVPPQDVADNVERFLTRGRSKRAYRVRVLLRLAEYATLPQYRAAFSELPLATRRRVVLSHWVEGRHVWRLCAKVRLLVTMGAYGDRRAHEFVGFVTVALRKRFAIKHAARSISSNVLEAAP